MSKDKIKELQNCLGALDKRYGKGEVYLMDDMPKTNIEVIPTGRLSIDYELLGIGGLPKGRITEIYGPESSGKTTIAIHAIAECQKMGGVAAFIDMEHAFDKVYARALGVDTKTLVFTQPDNGEKALEIAESLIRSGAVDLVVVDSVSGLVPQAEIEGEMGDSKMGLQARLMSQAMRKLIPPVSATNTCLVFINQTREKIGVMFGNPETTSGGNALKFAASVRIRVSRKGTPNKDGSLQAVSSDTFLETKKNKLYPPFKKIEMKVFFGEGFDKYLDIEPFAVEYDIIQKSGSWYSYEGTKIAQGQAQLKQFFMDNDEVFDLIRNKVLAAAKNEEEAVEEEILVEEKG